MENNMESNKETKASFSTGVQLLFVILGSAGMFLLSRFGIMRSREYVIMQFTYPMLLVLTGCRLRWKWILTGGAVFTILSICISTTLFPPVAPCSILVSRMLILLKGLVTALIVKCFQQKSRGSQWAVILAVVLSSIVATLLYFAAARYDLMDRMSNFSDRDAMLAETLQYAVPGFVMSGIVFMLGGLAAVGIDRMTGKRKE